MAITPNYSLPLPADSTYVADTALIIRDAHTTVDTVLKQQETDVTTAKQAAIDASKLVGAPAGEAVRTAISEGGAARNELSAAIGDRRSVVSPADVWMPGQESAVTVEELTHDALFAEWDALLSEHPDWVTRTDMGASSVSGKRIWRYEFTPPSPEKTIFLTGGIHGSERVGSYAILRTMQQVAADWNTHPALSHLRWGVRVVVMPLVNMVSGRKNANGVDINRNFPHNWADGTSNPASVDYRGTAPFSEPETLAIRSTIDEFADDLIGGFDGHDTGMTVDGTPPPFYITFPEPTIRTTTREWPFKALDAVAAIDPRPGVPSFSYTNTSTLKNYGASRGFQWATVEYEQGSGGGAALSAIEMTRAVRIFGSLISELSRARKPSVELGVEPFVREHEFRSGSSQSVLTSDGTSTHQEFIDLRDEFDIPGEGVVLFSGDMILNNNAGAATVRLVPTINMLFSGMLSGAANSRDERFLTLDSAADRRAIPFTIAMPVFRTSNGSTPNKIRVGLWASSSVAGILSVYRYHGIVQFIPAAKADRYVRLTATGRGGTGAGAMQANSNNPAGTLTP